jgi:hypothetical protein
MHIRVERASRGRRLFKPLATGILWDHFVMVLLMTSLTNEDDQNEPYGLEGAATSGFLYKERR